MIAFVQKLKTKLAKYPYSEEIMPRSKKPTKSATDSSKLNNSADKWAEETIIVNGMPQVILFPEEE